VQIEVNYLELKFVQTSRSICILCLNCRPSLIYVLMSEREREEKGMCNLTILLIGTVESGQWNDIHSRGYVFRVKPTQILT